MHEGQGHCGRFERQELRRGLQGRSGVCQNNYFTNKFNKSFPKWLQQPVQGQVSQKVPWRMRRGRVWTGL